MCPYSTNVYVIQKQSQTTQYFQQMQSQQQSMYLSQQHSQNQMMQELLRRQQMTVSRPTPFVPSHILPLDKSERGRLPPYAHPIVPKEHWIPRMDTATQSKESYYRKMLDLLVTREFTAKRHDEFSGGLPGKKFEDEQTVKLRALERDYLLTNKKQTLHKLETALDRPRLDPLKPGHEVAAPRHEPTMRKNDNAGPKLETAIHNMEHVLKRNSQSVRKSDCLIEKSNESSKWVAVTKTTTVTDVIVTVKTNCAQCHGGSPMPQATAKASTLPMMMPGQGAPLPQLVQSSKPNAVALPRVWALPLAPVLTTPLTATKDPAAFPTVVVKAGPQLPSLLAMVQPSPQTLWATAVQPGLLPVFAFKLQNVPLTPNGETIAIGRLEPSLAALRSKSPNNSEVLPALIVDASPQGYYQALGRVSVLDGSEPNAATAGPSPRSDRPPLSDEDLQTPPARKLAAAIVEMPALPRNQELFGATGDGVLLAADTDLKGGALDLAPSVPSRSESRSAPRAEVVLEQLGTPAVRGPALMPE
jgi:hypothetical protein